MEKYDYKEALTQDIVNYIKDNDVLDYEYEDFYELEQTLVDEIWGTDIVGNAGYYTSKEKCEEFLYGNSQLLIRALLDLEVDIKSIEVERDETAQNLDCIIRLSLLYECIPAALAKLGIKEDNYAQMVKKT